jgi:glycosyltransferase involved in cell wall biosynthesis
LRVLTLSDLQNTGGASVACNRIANALSNCGVTVSSTSSDGFESSSHKPLFLGRKYQVLSTLFSSKIPSFILENLRIKELQKQLRSLLSANQPDIINAHNLHSAGWPISLIRTCLDYAPVVWTLHDCWSFLGSFYPTHSPAPSAKLKDEIDRFWNSLRINPPKHKLYATTPSTWMKNQAEESYWNEYPVDCIHNPIPDSYFSPKDRLACKRALELKEEKTAILCIAGNLKEERKGGMILNSILSEEWGSDAEFLLIGNGDSHHTYSENVKSLGFITDEISLQIAYHAADLVLHPAPVDNLPNTVAESLSCGTPVLAFDTGGLPEMVIPQQSGWLVPPGDHAGMISTLRSVLNTKSYSDLRNSCRSSASEKFQSSKIGKEYQDLFISCTAAK